MPDKTMLDEQAVIACYEEHETARIVAEKFGVSDQTIYRILERNDIKRTHRHEKKPKGRSRKYCPALVGICYFVDGISAVSMISDIANIPVGSVSNILSRKYGVHHPLRRTYSNDVDLDEIERLYLEGVSCYALGEKYDVNHATISKWMRKRGHIRGKGGGAVKRNNQKRHEEAIARWGVENADKDKRHYKKRKQLIWSRRRDIGVTWQALAKRNGSMRCEICGIECDPKDKTWGSSGPSHPSVDHILRICDGGTDTFDNARLACCACNLKENVRHQRLMDEVITHAEEQAAAHKCA